MTPTRWPVHPPPQSGEALSSWLIRVAASYGLQLEDLIAYNLGAASLDIGKRDEALLDRDPPAGVLLALHERTGVPLHQIERMTIGGWMPWLLDTFDPTEPDAFATFVRQDSVLLPAGEIPSRPVGVWLAWLPPVPLRRACPSCRQQPECGFTLMSQLPLMLSCPQHGCRLEFSFGTLGTFVGWNDHAIGYLADATEARPVADAVASIMRLSSCGPGPRPASAFRGAPRCSPGVRRGVCWPCSGGR